jgi:hypothetical protein
MSKAKKNFFYRRNSVLDEIIFLDAKKRKKNIEIDRLPNITFFFFKF